MAFVYLTHLHPTPHSNPYSTPHSSPPPFPPRPSPRPPHPSTRPLPFLQCPAARGVQPLVRGSFGSRRVRRAPGPARAAHRVPARKFASCLLCLLCALAVLRCAFFAVPVGRLWFLLHAPHLPPLLSSHPIAPDLPTYNLSSSHLLAPHVVAHHTYAPPTARSSPKSVSWQAGWRGCSRQGTREGTGVRGLEGGVLRFGH